MQSATDIEFKVTCKECQKEASLKEGDMSEKAVTMEDGQDIVLTVWTCPNCHKACVCQLDNTETRQKFSNLRFIVSRMRRDISMGKQQSQSDLRKSQELDASIQQLRSELQARYDMSFYQFGDTKQRLDIQPPEAHIPDQMKGAIQ